MIATLNALVDHIEENLGEPIDVAGFARRHGTTEYHLRRMFASLAQLPLSEYIRNRRMTLAGAELAAGAPHLRAGDHVPAAGDTPAARAVPIPSSGRPASILEPGFNLTLRPMKYPAFYDMFRDAIKNTWTVEEIDFSDDLVDLDRKLLPAEYQGSTFTISNLGAWGIEEFTAIINPPNSAIVAIGAAESRPVVVNGQIVVRDRMKVTMSCDHRVIDGALGADFLKTLRQYIEQPLRLMI